MLTPIRLNRRGIRRLSNVHRNEALLGSSQKPARLAGCASIL